MSAESRRSYTGDELSSAGPKTSANSATDKTRPGEMFEWNNPENEVEALQVFNEKILPLLVEKRDRWNKEQEVYRLADENRRDPDLSDNLKKVVAKARFEVTRERMLEGWEQDTQLTGITESCSVPVQTLINGKIKEWWAANGDR